MYHGEEVKLLSPRGVYPGGYKWPHAVLCGGEVLWLQAHVQLYFCAQDVMRFACVVWVELPGYL